jgi:hypothetical protein
MCDLDLYAAIAVFIVTSINLLKCSSHEIKLNKWLLPFSVGWVISGLTLFLPMVQKGALGVTVMVYFLMGALIVNTLVLSLCSKLPNHVIALKSPTVEMMGGVILRLMGTGLYVMFKDLWVVLFRWINTMIEAYSQRIARLGEA